MTNTFKATNGVSERQRIKREDIRKGDLIRIEQVGYDEGIHGFYAVEWVASAGGQVPAAVSWADAHLYLLERPVVLPTRLYSLVVPPSAQRDLYVPYMLDDWDDEKQEWVQGGVAVDAERVENALRDGWIAIDGPEVLDGV